MTAKISYIFTAGQRSLLAMQSAVLATRFCPFDRLSDRPSVTRWYHAKTTQGSVLGSSVFTLG